MKSKTMTVKTKKTKSKGKSSSKSSNARARVSKNEGDPGRDPDADTTPRESLEGREVVIIHGPLKGQRAYVQTEQFGRLYLLLLDIRKGHFTDIQKGTQDIQSIPKIDRKRISGIYENNDKRPPNRISKPMLFHRHEVKICSGYT